MRTLQIPARLVVGFAGDTTVHSRDVRVWAELRYPGTGWVTYDPTPPSTRDAPPLRAEPPPADIGAVLPTGDELPPPPPSPAPAGPGPWLRIGAVLLLLAAVALALRMSAPVLRRAWRRYRPAGPDARVVGAWHDVLDAYVPPPGTRRAALTPGLLHDQVAERLSGAESAGRTLSRLADRALYSPQSCSTQDGAVAWRSAGQVRRALRRRARAGVR
jgi:hypothetical protein